jgi:hypothetical protein
MNCYSQMIRTREQNYPPPYQIELAKDLARVESDLALAVLKAEPLYSIIKAEFTHEKRVVRTSWWEQPVYYTEHGDKVLKVLYSDSNYLAEDKLKKADRYGNTQIHFSSTNETIYDLGENDSDYHVFWCGEFNFFLKKLASGQEVYTILFEDIRSGRTFITEIYQMSLST